MEGTAGRLFHLPWRAEKINEKPESGWSVSCQFLNQTLLKDKTELLPTKPTKINVKM
jgi:hypothetical protein